MASINQNRSRTALPDFRNLGVILRVLIAVSAMTLAVAAIGTYSASAGLEAWLGIIARVAPVTILSLVVLGVASRWLRTLDRFAAVVIIVAAEAGITLLLLRLSAGLFGPPTGGLLRPVLFAVGMTLLLLAYFDLRNRALSPAITEARLQALQARIRPHFFFNSINAVLSLVRSQPKRAEEALHDLAELFRVLMADNRDLIPLRRELEICRQYLSIEQLRLGERLRVDWQIEGMPPDAMVPPLLLQPVLENAVYHGIEPASEPGTVTVTITSSAEQLNIHLRNPYRGESRHQSGNRMALANIRERLLLHFDAEARLTTKAGEGVFEVDIALPYVKEKP
jgi:two-component system sensor histidine kinase AlgZ